MPTLPPVSCKMTLPVAAAERIYQSPVVPNVLWDFEVHRHALTQLPTAIGTLPEDFRQLIEQTEGSVGSVLAVGRR